VRANQEAVAQAMLHASAPLFPKILTGPNTLHSEFLFAAERESETEAESDSDRDNADAARQRAPLSQDSHRQPSYQMQMRELVGVVVRKREEEKDRDGEKDRDRERERDRERKKEGEREERGDDPRQLAPLPQDPHRSPHPKRGINLEGSCVDRALARR